MYDDNAYIALALPMAEGCSHANGGGGDGDLPPNDLRVSLDTKV